MSVLGLDQRKARRERGLVGRSEIGHVEIRPGHHAHPLVPGIVRPRLHILPYVDHHHLRREGIENVRIVGIHAAVVIGLHDLHLADRPCNRLLGILPCEIRFSVYGSVTSEESVKLAVCDLDRTAAGVFARAGLGGST